VMEDQQLDTKTETRLDQLPKELRDPPVAFAAVSFIGPLFLVLLGLIAGQTEPSSPIYTIAAVVAVVGLVGFIVTSIRRFFVRREENVRFEEERVQRRRARRPSASAMRQSRTAPAHETPDARPRRAS
jgi:hypothetical protein